MKLKDKLKSRKLWGFIVWTILMFFIVFKHPEVLGIAIPVYGGITMVYFGAQGAQDAAKEWKKDKDEG